MKRRFLLYLLACSFLFSGCSSHELSGNDWFLEQTSFYSDLEQASLSISDLFSLYFVGAVGTDDFSSELNLLFKQLSLSQEQYLNGKKKISPATHSYASKCGEEALTTAYKATLDLLSTSRELLQTTEQEKLISEYLEWREILITQIATYCTSQKLISEEERTS